MNATLASGWLPATDSFARLRVTHRRFNEAYCLGSSVCSKTKQRMGNDVEEDIDNYRFWCYLIDILHARASCINFLVLVSTPSHGRGVHPTVPNHAATCNPSTHTYPGRASLEHASVDPMASNRRAALSADRLRERTETSHCGTVGLVA